MVTAYDVAALIEQRKGQLDGYELQKLLYYAQAWSIAWDGKPLFNNEIEAWTDGPVTRDVWIDRDKGECRGNPGALSEAQVATVEAVLDFYGHLTGRQLVQLSHRERPWRDARRGLEAWEKSRNAIPHTALRSYFGKLGTPGEKRISEAVRRGVWVLLQTPEDAVDDLMADVDDPEAAEAFTDWLDCDEE